MIKKILLFVLLAYPSVSHGTSINIVDLQNDPLLTTEVGIDINEMMNISLETKEENIKCNDKCIELRSACNTTKDKNTCADYKNMCNGDCCDELAQIKEKKALWAKTHKKSKDYTVIKPNNVKKEYVYISPVNHVYSYKPEEYKPFISHFNWDEPRHHITTDLQQSYNFSSVTVMNSLSVSFSDKSNIYYNIEEVCDECNCCECPPPPPPPPSEVPIPSGILLISSGVLGLIGYKRLKKEN